MAYSIKTTRCDGYIRVRRIINPSRHTNSAVRKELGCARSSHVPGRRAPDRVRDDLGDNPGKLAGQRVRHTGSMLGSRRGRGHTPARILDNSYASSVHLGGGTGDWVRTLCIIAGMGAIMAMAGCSTLSQLFTRHVDSNPPIKTAVVLLPPVTGKQFVSWTSDLAVNCPEDAWVLERPVTATPWTHAPDASCEINKDKK